MLLSLCYNVSLTLVTPIATSLPYHNLAPLTLPPYLSPRRRISHFLIFFRVQIDFLYAICMFQYFI